jgi:argininosuccinate lyase
MVREGARNNEDAQSLLDDVMVIFSLPFNEAHEIVAHELRFIQEQQVQQVHDTIVLEAIEEGV